MGTGSDVTLKAYITALRAGLRKLSWVEDRNHDRQ
jgi:hypothetical protein